MNELLALLEGRVAGTARQRTGRHSFSYEDSWRQYPGAFPLSLSMPLAVKDHDSSAAGPFLWGLLPDNEFVLDNWSKRFHVSARNPFALLRHVGEDCAGAVQFVPPERLETLLGQPGGGIEWIEDTEIARRLRDLRNDASVGRIPGDSGQFSLAGAQPKTALYFDNGRWGIPSGRTPTTHILKPQTGDLDGHAENEHLCLALAARLGLPAASSTVQRFEDVSAIVVARYDRLRARQLADTGSDQVYRVHQEDMCQALAKLPGSKYQNEGGPSAVDIAGLLRTYVSDAAGEVRRGLQPAVDLDVDTFIGALIFNWLIGGTDAHAKNYSLLIGARELVRLAPLYDLASTLPYPRFDPRRLKLAMKIGGEYELMRIGAIQWRKFAKELRSDEDRLLAQIRNMAAAFPDALSDEIRRARRQGLDHPIMARMQAVLTDRARTALADL